MVVGIFVIAGLCSLVWLIFKFGDLPGVVTKMNAFQVFVQFPTATGVQKDTPVRFCGYQIGRVTNVMAPEVRKDKLTDLEYAKKLEAECVYWPTSRLVAHVAWTITPRMGVVTFPQLDMAVARELDRQLPAPTKIERTRRGTP